MRAAGRMFRCVIALALILAVPRPSAAARSLPSGDTVERIAGYVAESLREAGLPGGSVAVVSEGSVVLAKGFGKTGFFSDTPVSAETLYAVASITKTMTATAVLQLYEGGRIDLDAPVQRYLPWFQVGTDPTAAEITVRHLLNHTSGLPANAHRVVWQDPGTIRGSLEAGVRALQAIELRHRPGQVFEYANMNYAVLGLIVERVSGDTWGHYLQTHIFDRLGMAHTTTDLRRAEALGLADSHMPQYGRLVPAPLDSGEFYAPAYRVFASAPDMAVYAAALMDGRLIRTDTFKAAYLSAALTGSEFRYGLGWMTAEYGGRPVVFHGGDGSHSADLYLLPDQRLAVVLLVGAYSPVRKNEITRGILGLLQGEAPARLQGQGDFYNLLWLSRVLTGLGGIACASVLWLPFAMRRTFRRMNREGRPYPLWRTVIHLLLALLGWLVVVWYVPVAFPEAPFAFGFQGWPVDVAFGIAAIVTALTVWACASLTFTFCWWVRRPAARFGH